jgi:hypothetical protein
LSRLKGIYIGEKISPHHHIMFLITVHLQVPRIGLDTYIDWQPNNWRGFFGHTDMAMTVEIVILHHMPFVYIAANFTASMV